MAALLFLLGVVAVVAYVVLLFKIGFWLADAFDGGFFGFFLYMSTVLGGIFTPLFALAYYTGGVH